jgi:hypothetical protein
MAHALRPENHAFEHHALIPLGRSKPALNGTDQGKVTAGSTVAALEHGALPSVQPVCLRPEAAQRVVLRGLARGTQPGRRSRALPTPARPNQLQGQLQGQVDNDRRNGGAMMKKQIGGANVKRVTLWQFVLVRNGRRGVGRDLKHAQR